MVALSRRSKALLTLCRVAQGLEYGELDAGKLYARRSFGHTNFSAHKENGKGKVKRTVGMVARSR